MESDNAPVGRLLTRREVLALIGMSSAAALIGCKPGRQSPPETTEAAGSLPPCVVRPEQTEGPYFVDERLNRSDIRSEPGSRDMKDGIPLELTFQVSRLSGGRCTPLAGAFVDLWHCDAEGVYSDVTDPHFNTVGVRCELRDRASDRLRARRAGAACYTSGDSVSPLPSFSALRAFSARSR